jgi:hypothetical protein
VSRGLSPVTIPERLGLRSGIQAVMTAPTKRRIPEGLLTPLLIGFALPVYQIYHIAKFAKTRDRLAAPIGTFVVFASLIAVLSVLWGFPWLARLWAIWQLFAR